MSTERTQTIAPAVAAVASVHAAVTLGTSAQTVTTGITHPDVYRCVCVKGNQASVTGNVTVTGTDWNGATISDVIAASGASTVNGVKPMKTVVSVALPARAAAGDTISIGCADIFGLYGDITATGDVILAERAAAAATEFSIEATGTVSATYNTVTATVVAGDRLRWTYLDSGYVAAAGSTLFTVAEARAFGKLAIADATKYTDAAILEAEARIREDFETICSVHFVPTSRSEDVDGTGDRSLMLQAMELTAVSACIIYDSTGAVSEEFDATDLSDLAVYSWGKVTRRSRGTFARGDKNISITYTAGYATVPGPIKYAALKVLEASIIPSNLDQRMTAMSTDGHTWTLAVAGRSGQWYGLPEVDAILQRYNRSIPGVA